MVLTARLALFSLLALVRFHSIHISYAKAEVDGATVHVKVSYYKDDFMLALDQWYGGKIASFSSEKLRNGEIAYFNNFLRLWSEPQFTHQLKLNTCTLQDDGTSLIFDATFLSDTAITMLTIDHRAICKQFSDQMNILTLFIFNSEKNIISSASKPTITVEQK